MRDFAQIKEIARFQFRQRYGMCVGAALLFILLFGGSSRGFSFQYNYDSSSLFGNEFMPIFMTIIMVVAVIAILGSIFVGGPVTVGYADLCCRVYVGIPTSVGAMFSAGFRNYWRSVGGMLWMNLFIFLWSLLLLIPGIVKSLAYFATPYILAEFPHVNATEALKISMRMTDGYKGEIFVLRLTFIGWYLLNAFTFGLLGIFYVNPYYYTTMAGMYQDLKMNALYNGSVRYEELMGYSAPPPNYA